MTKHPSTDSLVEATRSRTRFSGHGQAKGAAGYKECLSEEGQTSILYAPEGGFGKIRVGAAWDNIAVANTGMIGKLFKKITRQGIDIDLGCLYELQDGTRGAVQAFGGMFGKYDQAPYIFLSGDERTGNAQGDDEFIRINGRHWGDIKRLLFYVYIYHGTGDWSLIRPKISVAIAGEEPLLVVPKAEKSELAVCAVAMMDNAGGHIKLTNHTEYFPGHAEMDRAFGFGLQWDDGNK